jgi:hypothetical protein
MELTLQTAPSQLLRLDIARLLISIVARDTVREVASLLEGTGIAVVPLKGVLLHATVYKDPTARPLSDVDILVPAPMRRSAEDKLRLAGWRLVSSEASSSMFVKAERPLPLDLHFDLYSARRYGPLAEELIGRATPDRTLFGAEVRLPQPNDVYAHLVGHFAKDRRDHRQPYSLLDFAAVAERHDLDARVVARHLDDNGLGRAARYSLSIARDHAGDRFAASVLAELRSDPLGERLSALARFVVKYTNQPSKVAAIPGALLDRTLHDSMISLATQTSSAASRSLRRLRMVSRRGLDRLEPMSAPQLRRLPRN